MTRKNKSTRPLCRQVFYHNQADIQNTALIAGNMYGYHFASYTKCSHFCLKGQVSLEQEFTTLSSSLKEQSSKSVVICPTPGLPTILTNYDSLDKDEIVDILLDHIYKLERLSRKYNRLFIVLGYLPVQQGKYLNDYQVAKINSILSFCNRIFETHSIFNSKIFRFFDTGKRLPNPKIRACGIYPTGTTYRQIGNKVREYIFKN